MGVLLCVTDMCLYIAPIESITLRTIKGSKFVLYTTHNSLLVILIFIVRTAFDLFFDAD